MTRSVFWFRRDLRLRDNVGLNQARKAAEELVPLFIVDASHPKWPHRNADRLRFKLNAVASLRESIRANGADLVVRTGDVPDKITEFCRNHEIDSIHWNRGYEPYERDRDGTVRQRLEPLGVEMHSHKDHVLHERQEILTNDKTPYKVFSYYARKWRNRPAPEPVGSVSSFEVPSSASAGTIPSVGDLDMTATLTEPDWTPTPRAARSRWEEFLTGDLINYHDNRDFPAREATSGLSPHLRFGLVSPRRLRSDCEEVYRSRETTEGVETFVDELIWRDFYHQVLYNFPSVTDENFLSKYDGLNWENHPEWLEAWKNGRTGVPIVDAAMRQLNRTGWMHNRLRMIVASFLTKDCFIHWKEGEKYFMNNLLDGDTAANNGGWQWAASTGTDAAPYFRIFNPYSQSETYDPEGTFIRKFCPELKDLEGRDLHAPHEADDATLSSTGVTLGETYPEPILDHSRRREIALEKFKAIE